MWYWVATRVDVWIEIMEDGSVRFIDVGHIPRGCVN